MQLLEQIAQEVVEKTSNIIECPISITDNAGIIIGSTDKSRLGIFHQPSLEVIKKNAVIDCTTEIKNTILPGISVPIKFNNKIIGVLGIVGSPREVEKYVHLVKNQVEMMCQEAFQNELLDLKEKMIEMFVYELINYNELNIEKIEQIQQYANLLDINLHKNKVCLLIKINRFSKLNHTKQGNDEFFNRFQYFRKEVIGFLKLIFHCDKDDIVSLIDFETFIIIKSLPYKQSYSSLLEGLDDKLMRMNSFLENKYLASVAISVGDINSGIKGIAESYQNAVTALNIEGKNEEKSGVFIYKERETLLWLLPKELTPNYREKLLKTIKPLIEQDSFDVLSSTFIEYCKCNMNISEAARNLYIHRNTLIYRLEKINEITSLATNNFEHCMLLYIAIQCYVENHQKELSHI